MRNKFMLITTMITVLCATYLFFNKTPINASKRIYIQALIDSPILKNISQSLSGKINTIIKEELNLDQNNEVDFFLPKKNTKTYFLLS